MVISNFFRIISNRLWGEQPVCASPEVVDSAARLAESTKNINKVTANVLEEVKLTEKLLGGGAK